MPIKILSLLLLLNAPFIQAQTPNLALEIKHISALNEPAIIHQRLLQLKQKNQQLLQTLMTDNSYQPDLYNYANTLALLLEHIPKNRAHMPRCESLKESLMYDYRTSWENLDPPTHVVWIAFKKICKA